MSQTRERVEQLQIGDELAELCRTHGIQSEWLRQSGDLDGLLERVARECDDQLDALESGDAGDPAAARVLGRLRELTRFGHRASTLRRRSGAAPAFVGSVDDLERACRQDRGDSPEDAAWVLQTLSALATLCHKANNPLTSLMGRSQILQIQKPDDAQVVKAAKVIEESAQRVSASIDEMAQIILRGRERLGNQPPSSASAGPRRTE